MDIYYAILKSEKSLLILFYCLEIGLLLFYEPPIDI